MDWPISSQEIWPTLNRSIRSDEKSTNYCESTDQKLWKIRIALKLNYIIFIQLSEQVLD